MEQATVGIVGAGPIGLEMAIGLKKSGIDYLQFDGRQIGHTISWFAPQTRFFSSPRRISIAGVPLMTSDQTRATREQYLTYLRQVATQFDLRVRTYEPVVEIQRQEGRLSLKTAPASGERRYSFEKIILATGGTTRPRRLEIPGEDLPHVNHYFQDPHLYWGRRILIVGGRNSAVEAALRCHHAGAKVAISYRGDAFDARAIKYWLMPEMQGLIESGTIKAHFNTQPVAITPDAVELRNLRDGQTCAVAADFVLLQVGYVADLSLCEMAGVRLIGPTQSPEHDPQTMRTNVPGVYVAGTVVGGTQDRYALFLENCHIHVERILADLLGYGPTRGLANRFAGPAES